MNSNESQIIKKKTIWNCKSHLWTEIMWSKINQPPNNLTIKLSKCLRRKSIWITYIYIYTHTYTIYSERKKEKWPFRNYYFFCIHLSYWLIIYLIAFFEYIILLLFIFVVMCMVVCMCMYTILFQIHFSERSWKDVTTIGQSFLYFHFFACETL